jgi:hypothetical protein
MHGFELLSKNCKTSPGELVWNTVDNWLTGFLCLPPTYPCSP